MDAFERQRAFQNHLLQQSGGGIDPETPVGTFEFDIEPFMDRRSATMGVRERHFTTRSTSSPRRVATHHPTRVEYHP